MFEHKPNHLEDELCFSIYTAQRFYNRFYTEALKKYNLTYAQYITLLVLWESKEKMIIRDLGLRLKLDTGTLTPLLKRMEKEGWVTRTKTKADGRKVYITLTDKALELEDQIKDRVTGCFASADMSSDEYKNAVKFIQDIAKKLEDNNKFLVEKTKF
ncbi:MarR family transcriptional regulator [Ligilactobacillus murinus DSM 20452 = NBRC 14221]|jgi:DNA-binding MarR family transcriptional regulator|uniref:MarR family transcriptional regulator n=1 Tax=Ligilactobacillus murinus DSM 20452 = NBRC 14221 TaxID=1423772 RepID=A0A0R2BH92_9LACO|nr:MarR family transcriptional regulator [Ligilactobacillus murinus]KRM76900.1 MarR family transcriptional regulator [Ligilactobacillus murinus DSM 20452 = NBRC 14221]TGY51916.1 MarR family transcriptional regulator [Ligilactobacillus murinus]